MNRAWAHPWPSSAVRLFLAWAPAVSLALSPSTSAAQWIPAGLQCLQKAYPTHLCRAATNSVRWCDGTVTVYDDGRKKSFKQLLDRPDLQDQMSMRYPAGPRYPVPLPQNFDPGRVRHEPFFKKMYGTSPAQVRRNLARVRWVRAAARTQVRVTRINGVHRKVAAVARELDRLAPRFSRFLTGRAESFLWRTVHRTSRLSPHSFGIAIDIAVRHAHYWRWTRPGPDGRFRYKNSIPWEIVAVFEKHGFIWGGKWYHFDTMHFEFRPELLVPPCVKPPGPKPGPARPARPRSVRPARPRSVRPARPRSVRPARPRSVPAPRPERIVR